MLSDRSHGAGRKLFIVDTRIMPNVAILDPCFTMSLPKDMTVSTAMDALTHAIRSQPRRRAQTLYCGHADHAQCCHPGPVLYHVTAQGYDRQHRHGCLDACYQIAATAQGANSLLWTRGSCPMLPSWTRALPCHCPRI